MATTELQKGFPVAFHTRGGFGMRPGEPYASLDAFREDLQGYIDAFDRLPNPGPRALSDARSCVRNAARWLRHWGIPLPDWYLAAGEPATADEAVQLMVRLARVTQEKPAQPHRTKQQRKPAKRDKAMEARDRWIYNQAMKGTLWKTIMFDLNKLAAEKRWDRIGTPNGIRSRAFVFAARHKKPKPPPRQNR